MHATNLNHASQDEEGKRRVGKVVLELQQWVAKRPSSLRIHRRQAVSELPTPGSGQSPQSAIDPKLSLRFSDSGLSAKPRFFELAATKLPLAT